ncbi:MAG: sigma-70 family RNA polymerase sigma factor [Patescibacteria group bacterium]|nr:sigma-70 family RNA polymerase sigma factor [Patescibacteria group bacterium]
MRQSSVYIFSSLEDNQPGRLPAEVFNKARGGDSAAFGEIYNRFFQKIYRFIYFRVSHKELAEDLAEEVFLKAFAKIHSIRQELALEGWLYQIARNLVIDYYRQKRTEVDLSAVENTLEYEFNVIDALSLDQDQKLLLKLINQLPEEQQIVIKLKFFENLNNETIAEMLHKSQGAIRVIQHRAITKLQTLLQSHISNNHE